MKLNKQKVARIISTQLPKQCEATATDFQSIIKMNLLCDLFPELNSLELYYNCGSCLWELSWHDSNYRSSLTGSEVFPFQTKAAAVARLTTWLNEWAQGDLIAV